MQKQDGFILFDNWQEFRTWLNKQTIKRSIKTIQHHHTWSPNYANFTGSNHFKLCVSMKNYHVNSAGMIDIAQNLTTFPDGKIMLCRNLETTPAGISRQNTGAVCIENVANFDSDNMTEKHKDCILGLTATLCMKFNIDVNKNTNVYHHWFDLNTGKCTYGAGTTKPCPGIKFFGGNKVTNAESTFYPAVKSYINKIKNSDKEKEIEELKKLMEIKFKDMLIGNKAHWANDNVNSLYEKGIVKGDGEGNFNPDKPITRAEAAALIDRAVKYLDDKINKLK